MKFQTEGAGELFIPIQRKPEKKQYQYSKEGTCLAGSMLSKEVTTARTQGTQWTVLTEYRGGSAGPGESLCIWNKEKRLRMAFKNCKLDSAETKVAAVFPYTNNSCCAWFICLIVCPVSANKRCNSSQQGLFLNLLLVLKTFRHTCHWLDIQRMFLIEEIQRWKQSWKFKNCIIS